MVIHEYLKVLGPFHGPKIQKVLDLIAKEFTDEERKQLTGLLMAASGFGNESLKEYPKVQDEGGVYA